MSERRDAYRVLVGKAEGRRQLEDTGVDGSIILKWILEKWNGGMDWISRNRERWWALVNAVMNLRVF